MAQEDFYIGYQSGAPPALARFLRLLVSALLLATAVMAALVAASQRSFDPGVFEFGRLRVFEGVVRERPYPHLEVRRPAGADRPGDGAAAVSRYLLVAFGKHGAQRAAAGLDGQRVEVEGSLIYRGDQTMLEIASGLAEGRPEERGMAGPKGAAALPGELLGHYTMVGEIVDSKCYLGVMKPGRGKPHRACAARCISGGIPPVLRVAVAGGGPDGKGAVRHFLLLDEEGKTVNRRVLSRVAEPVAITGEVRRLGDLLVLAADPNGYRRP